MAIPSNVTIAKAVGVGGGGYMLHGVGTILTCDVDLYSVDLSSVLAEFRLSRDQCMSRH